MCTECHYISFLFTQHHASVANVRALLWNVILLYTAGAGLLVHICLHVCVCVYGQVQALAHYDDVRLKSEKAGIHIVTYQLPQAPDHGEFGLNWSIFF